MAIEYCNTTYDLQDVLHDVVDYNRKTTVLSTDWELVSGAVYKLEKTGYVNMVFDDGVELTAESSETTTPAAGKFSYITSSDILYVRLSDDTDPDSSTMEIGIDWDTFKGRARNDAQEMLEGFLRQVYAVPFQKIVSPGESYNSRDYDYWVRRATAILTCYIIVSKVNPGDPNADRLYRMVDNPNVDVGEPPGIVQRILDGDIALRTQLTARETGGFNVYEGSSNASTAYVKINGYYSGSQKQVWKVVIDTAGAPGTATYKLSLDGGSNYDFTLQETRQPNSDDRRVNLNGGIYTEFVGTFVLADEWTIELFPSSDQATVPVVGTIQLVR